MTIKVFMTPSPDKVQGVNGIEQVVINYNKYMPDFGFEYVNNPRNADLIANHAGTGQIIDGYPFVSHLHGLYWTSDYDDSQLWQYKANANVIESIRKADQVTVPSEWVAETIRRDMRFNPHVIEHGINIDEWKPQLHQGYVLWNKNRSGDVCYTEPLEELAKRFPNVLFASTFSNNPTPNIKTFGTLPHHEMKQWILQSCVYLSSTKETFGIGILEAMASGVPILGFDFGGNSEIVKHGVCGYLAEPNNYDDLANGLAYCLEHRNTLGANAREIAKRFTWRDVCEKVANVYKLALEQQEPTASIIIPVYNKQYHETKRAVMSAVKQSYKQLEHIVVVDDGSENEADVKKALSEITDKRIMFVRQNNQGVANARNNGIKLVDSKYITCLDADDELKPDFLTKLIPHLEYDKSLGIVYSRLSVLLANGKEKTGRWPGDCDFDAQVQGKNQVPTCCVFRRKVWERLGGYKQRYAPEGCGAEDAEFWLRVGAYGWKIKQATKEPLFVYSMGGRTMREDYQEPDWLSWHPWTRDKQHPFASIATPEQLSHPVRQYDKPVVSVIIPVGPGHEKDLYNALDSLEAQTIRQWEAIVVNDSGKELDLTAYPYVKLLTTDGQKGAGYARNKGAEIARSPFIVFLDADDWLYPEFLEICLDTWEQENAIIYTDYVGKAIISLDHAKKLQDADRLHAYSDKTGEAVIAHKSAEYDCELAQQQPRPTGNPNQPFYHWCLVSCLIPKDWHNEIGGFDENMPTWEDIDYHWRLARKGKCYVRVPQELIVYNFHTGQRREYSKKIFSQVVEYIKQKYESEDIVMCKSCGSKIKAPAPRQAYSVFSTSQVKREPDSEYIWVKYIANPNNRSDGPVVGHITQKRYGYGHYGSIFLVHRDDVFDYRGNLFGRFEPVPEKPQKPKKLPVLPQASKSIEPPKPIIKPVEKKVAPTFDDLKELVKEDISDSNGDDIVTSELVDLQTIPGITSGIANQLVELGIQSVDAILDFGVEGLSSLKRCDEDKAQMIINAVEARFL